MANNKQTSIAKDASNKKISISRQFDAPVEHVWRAWTEKELLDQWWAPHPWRAETKALDFRVGGFWLYSMVNEAGERHWSRADFKAIDTLKSIQTANSFCDEIGFTNQAYPKMDWHTEFHSTPGGTEVCVDITFEKGTDFKAILEMGFEAGFTAALANLEQYLSAQFKLRNQLKTNTMSRTTTYLNFPGTTEEAFLFYKSVFGTTFGGKGIQRFGDIPAEPGNPVMADNVKKLVLHVELPILGGHVLMATDAPKEMGMTVIQGNNMHICLEPETKAETKRLFDALTKGGTIIMPLADMFFGAYFGQCTDRFGINWMFNCTNKN